MITKNAIRLIEVVGKEYAFQVTRADKQFIPASKILACTIGALTAKCKRDKDLKIFLNTIAFIPKREDEVGTYRWAKDPREPNAVTGVRPEREQRSRDDDIGLVPAVVHSVPTGL